MANRPNAHIVGDKAVRKISDKLIPEEWTISTPDSDYGLDMLIEIVQNDKTTGRLFFIQSKGTEKSSNDGHITYLMEVDRIKDYSNIKLPVLFVLYSKTDDKFWGRWMNFQYKTLTDTQKKQKKVTLHFFDYNEIDEDYLRRISNDIDLSLTNRVSIYCKKLPEQFKRFHIQALNVASQYIGCDITNDVRLTCETIFIYYNGTLQNGYANLQYGRGNINIPISLKFIDFLYYSSVREDECPNCLLELIYIIAIYASLISDKSQDYVLKHPSRQLLGYIPFYKWDEFITQLSSDKIMEISKLFNIAMQGQYNDIVQLIIIIMFFHSIDNDKNKNLYNELLYSYLISDVENEIKGKLFYSIANSFRDINLYKAFSYYMMAIKYEKAYKEVYYWWQEVAGILYITRHFKFAEQFYKKARNLSPDCCCNNIEILISDCLICQGKIDDALLEEHNYVNKGKKISSVIQLKMFITEIILKQQINIFDATYWFNQGIDACHSNKFTESLEYFLFSWRFNDGDIEALTNALVQALNTDDVIKQIVIVSAIHELSPDESYKHLISILLSNVVEDELIDNFKRLIYFDK